MSYIYLLSRSSCLFSSPVHPSSKQPSSGACTHLISNTIKGVKHSLVCWKSFLSNHVSNQTNKKSSGVSLARSMNSLTSTWNHSDAGSGRKSCGCQYFSTVATHVLKLYNGKKHKLQYWVRTKETGHWLKNDVAYIITYNLVLVQKCIVCSKWNVAWRAIKFVALLYLYKNLVLFSHCCRKYCPRF